MKKYTLITLCLGLLFSSCKKDYEQNISSVVKGRFYDTTNKVPFPNITVKVGEYQSETINFIRDSNTCNVYGFKQYYMQVRMIVSNNPLPPLNIGVLDALQGTGGGEIYGKNRDTILNIPIKKNENFSLVLNIYDPAANKGYFGTPIPFSPITAAGDTVQGAPIIFFRRHLNRVPGIG